MTDMVNCEMTDMEWLHLGMNYRDNQDYEEAYNCFHKAALMNNPDAIKNLGVLYIYGEGVEQDLGKAIDYFRRVYDLNGSQDWLWHMLIMHDEFSKNKSCRRLYRSLLEYLLEHQEWKMLIIIGLEYDKGTIFPKDDKKRIECYEEAMKHGVKIGAECLGEMYFLGDGVERDYEKSYEMFMKFDGNASFIKPYYLGEMYRNGFYVQQNMELAEQEYKKIIESEVSMKSADIYYDKAAGRLREMARL